MQKNISVFYLTASSLAKKKKKKKSLQSIISSTATPLKIIAIATTSIVKRAPPI